MKKEYLNWDGIFGRYKSIQLQTYFRWRHVAVDSKDVKQATEKKKKVENKKNKRVENNNNLKTSKEIPFWEKHSTTWQWSEIAYDVERQQGSYSNN